jgi:hypothetical protein
MSLRRSFELLRDFQSHPSCGLKPAPRGALAKRQVQFFTESVPVRRMIEPAHDGAVNPPREGLTDHWETRVRGFVSRWITERIQSGRLRKVEEKHNCCGHWGAFCERKSFKMSVPLWRLIRSPGVAILVTRNNHQLSWWLLTFRCHGRAL